jgi:methoxymalonate biosynthesis acyl carrier protein
MNTVLEVLKGIRPEFDFASSEDFIADGMLDSYDVITLISELDQRYGISIAGTDILPENIRNVAAIKALLHKYGIAP